MSKIDYARSSATERLLNLHDTGKDFITKLRYIEPQITLEEIWDDLNNFCSCVMIDSREQMIVTEARSILKYEARAKQMIANL